MSNIDSERAAELVQAMPGDPKDKMVVITAIGAAEAEIERLRAENAKLERERQSYYNEASEGWTKFRAAEKRIAELERAIDHVLHATNPPKYMTAQEVCDCLRDLMGDVLKKETSDE